MNHCEAPLWGSILFDAGGEVAAQAATAALTRRGFRVVRSFDLRSALTAHADCECPHHGTARCTCQFVVMLVYGETGEPVVVTAHSHDAQARAQLVRDAMTQPDAQVARQVMAALVEAALTLQTAPVEEVTAHAG
ncbi:MAG: hypothetical protein HY023_01070 [Chloroflexi bacterium]|nr:hypothetical protein [Chloroflexota bacterium]